MTNSLSKRPELLIPIQDWRSLKVIKGFADAIYFGVQNYNMRAKANNFQRKDLSAIAEFCHYQEPIQVKAYLCTNILIYSEELEDLDTLIGEAKDAGIDAIIAHDIAAINIAKKHKMSFHISTQANISNTETAQFYESLGAERVNLARELSLNQIAEIKEQLLQTQIECFVHGAMCTSISGRCYFSATIHDSEELSANRGACSQPCRKEWKVIDDWDNEFVYDGQRFLNSKDLCMIEYIPQLFEAQIDAFKIEGRMKNPLYVRTVAECYWEAINSFIKGTYTEDKVKVWLERLSKVYNRGFHTGFYFQRPTAEEIELLESGNISPYKKTLIGTVKTFDLGSKSANILIRKTEIPIRVGDELIFMGSGTFSIEKVKKIILKGSKVQEALREKQTEPVKINIPLTQEVNPNDKVYILTKRNL